MAEWYIGGVAALQEGSLLPGAPGLKYLLLGGRGIAGLLLANAHCWPADAGYHSYYCAALPCSCALLDLGCQWC